MTLTMRNEPRLLLHYHIYKNAGMSLSKSLREVFKNDWWRWEDCSATTTDRLRNFKIFLENSPKVKAISSHTLPFLPRDFLNNSGRTIYNIALVRHPILRTKSIYCFEKNLKIPLNQRELSRRLTFKEWVTYNLERENKFTDYQTDFLAEAPNDTILGTVERYQDFLDKLEQLLGHALPLRIANVSQESESSYETQLNCIAKELEEVFPKLLEKNQKDLALWTSQIKAL